MNARLCKRMFDRSILGIKPILDYPQADGFKIASFH